MSGMKQGNTLSWQRPYWMTVDLSSIAQPIDPDSKWPFKFYDIDILRLLVTTRMAQSMAEARRLIEQNIIWRDLPDINLSWRNPVGTMERVKPFLHNSRYLLLEDSDVIMVGKNEDEAMCHRIHLSQGAHIA